jgi:hypothetical protein
LKINELDTVWLFFVLLICIEFAYNSALYHTLEHTC